jgi:hypothetical protein
LGVAAAVVLMQLPMRCPLIESQVSVQLKLTSEQKEEIRKAAAKLTDTLELSIEQLEDRIQPGYKLH